MCSVATNLVTPLKFEPILCATTLCHFARTRSDYVATHFILLSSTVEPWRAVLQAALCSFRNASAKMINGLVEMRNGLEKNLVLFPAVDLIDPICKHMWTWTLSIIITYFILFNLFIIGAFSVISSYGKSFWSFVYVIYCVGAGITTLISISDGLDPYLFLSKDGKDAIYEKRNGRRGVYFPPELEFFLYRYCEWKYFSLFVLWIGM